MKRLKVAESRRASTAVKTSEVFSDGLLEGLENGHGHGHGDRSHGNE
jgi:hypothetical protein